MRRRGASCYWVSGRHSGLVPPCSGRGLTSLVNVCPPVPPYSGGGLTSLVNVWPPVARLQRSLACGQSCAVWEGDGQCVRATIGVSAKLPPHTPAHSIGPPPGPPPIAPNLEEVRVVGVVVHSVRCGPMQRVADHRLVKTHVVRAAVGRLLGIIGVPATAEHVLVVDPLW